MTSTDLDLHDIRRQLLRSGLFDPQFYRDAYPDIDAPDALGDYIRAGEAAGRRPNPVFSPQYYRRQAMADLPAAHNALLHYVLHGERRGDKPNPAFDPGAYRRANRTLSEYIDHPLLHYLQVGRLAGLPVASGVPGQSLARVLGEQQSAIAFEASGGRDLLQLMRFKQALVRELGLGQGFAHYQQAFDLPEVDHIQRKPVVELGEFAYRSAAALHEIAPPGQPFELPLPRVIGGSEPTILAGVSDALFVACLVDARVRCRSGVIEQGGYAVLNCRDGAAGDPMDGLEVDPAVFHADGGMAWIVTPEEASDPSEIDEAFTLLGPHSDEFGHWMTDLLPRYIAASASGALPPVPVLIDAGMPAAHRQALESMLPPGTAIIALPSLATVRVRRLWCAPRMMPAVGSGVGRPAQAADRVAPPPRLITAIREMARRMGQTDAPSGGPRRIYLAHGSDRCQRITNAAEVAAAATARGFEIVDPSDFAFTEQVRLLRNADFVVGTAASHVPLAWFCRPGTRFCSLSQGDAVAARWQAGLLQATGIDVTLFTGDGGQRGVQHPEQHGYRIETSAFDDFLDRWPGTGASANANIDNTQSRSIDLPRHPHDLPLDDYEFALYTSDRPEILSELVQISREHFGFFTRHFPHTINYPWAARQFLSMASGTRALDIGSGLSPLPFFLARRGIHVDCVDNSDGHRVYPVQDDWNEWGFFDYHSCDPNLDSYNCDILDFVPTQRYDLIYSLCSLAHMKAVERQATLRLCKSWLSEGGRLLLAIDLLPGTDFVWNISGDREFEPREEHGTIDAVRRQLLELGFHIAEFEVKRQVPHSRTDLAFITAIAPAAHVPPGPPVFSFWDQPELQAITPFLDEWRAQYPDFFMLSDADIERLIEEFFPGDVNLYKVIRIPTCKSDIAILLGLYKYGGLYVDCHCGIADRETIDQLLASDHRWELIVYDKRRDCEARPAGELFPLNSVIFARANSAILLQAAANAFRNLRAHWEAEKDRGFEPYDIWELTGPGNLAETLLVPGSAPSRLKPEYEGRVRFLPEGPGEPVTRYVHHSYRVPGMHWSERQARERLFIADASTVGPDPHSPHAYQDAVLAAMRQTESARRRIDEAISLRPNDPADPELMRLQTSQVILGSGLFDYEFYLRTYPDVRDSGMDALDHYVRHGDAEGRGPNQVFLPNQYRQTVRPPLPAGRNALQHYIEEGEPAGLNATRLFNPRAYIEANPALRAFVDRPLFHFIKLGQAAGLAIRPLGHPRSGEHSGGRPRSRDLRIAAHLGVKDEIELIERTIAHLRAIGVDHIIVCDMESTDGTAEVLEKYRSDTFWILTLPNQLMAVDDTVWNARNLELIEQVPADWVLFLDADEFWIPASGSLKDCEALGAADALSVPRFNVPLGPAGPLIPSEIVPTRYDELLVIAEGIADFSTHLRHHPATPWIRGEVGPKVMARRDRIGGWTTGAHDLISPDGAPLRWARPADLLVSHLPLTSPARFARRVENIAEVLAGEDDDLISGDGAWKADAWHWRRWLALARQGRLDDEFNRNVFGAAELADLRRCGVVRSVAEMLRRLERRELRKSGVWHA